jgi:hypothetical protein
MLGMAYLLTGQPERSAELCRAQLARRRDTHVHIWASLVVALSANHVQERQPGMVDGAGRLDQLFSPGYRLKGWAKVPSNPAQVAMVAATSRSPWSAAHRNAVRRLASSRVTQS